MSDGVTAVPPVASDGLGGTSTRAHRAGVGPARFATLH